MAGYKDFANGNVLTGDELDGYLMRQVVMRFPSTTDRDAALSTVVEDGMVVHTDTGPNSSTDVLWQRIGGVWVPISSAWKDFTPVWRSGAGGPSVAIGNGISSGWWRYVGGMVAVDVDIARGSTTNIGTNYYTWELPVTPAHILRVHGTALVYQAPAHRTRAVHGFSGSEIIMSDDAGNTVGATPNGSITAWGAGNRLAFAVEYRPA